MVCLIGCLIDCLIQVAHVYEVAERLGYYIGVSQAKASSIGITIRMTVKYEPIEKMPIIHEYLHNLTF